MPRYLGSPPISGLLRIYPSAVTSVAGTINLRICVLRAEESVFFIIYSVDPGGLPQSDLLCQRNSCGWMALVEWNEGLLVT